MQMKKRYNKGITLIALVITIIVLLILAGITFNYDPNDWTKNNVTVTITTSLQKLSIQYAKNEPEKESS